MVIVQPFSSRLVVTVRPFASVVEDIALACELPPFEREETLTDDLAEPDPDWTLTELAPPEALAEAADAPFFDIVLVSRPSSAIVMTSQSSPETLTCPASTGPAAVAARTAVIRGVGQRRDMSAPEIGGGAARRPRLLPT